MLKISSLYFKTLVLRSKIETLDNVDFSMSFKVSNLNKNVLKLLNEICEIL